MENTLENKAKFFAQYLGCKINSSLAGTVLNGEWVQRIQDEETDFQLLLKPLTAISEEDATEVAGLYSDLYLLPEVQSISVWGYAFTYQYRSSKRRRVWHVYFSGLNSAQADFLRSKGYALPFMGLSVESQISYGWVKLADVC